jgi:hypothetical protein
LDLHSPDFVPGGAKYGDVDGLLTLGSAELNRLANADAVAAGAWIAR